MLKLIICSKKAWVFPPPKPSGMLINSKQWQLAKKRIINSRSVFPYQKTTAKCVGLQEPSWEEIFTEAYSWIFKFIISNMYILKV